MSKEHPIGIFDSGVGGTSIWSEISALLPTEHYIYLADSKNAPYGEKSKDEIIALCHKNTRHLIEQFNCKIIVVACNTATTNAIAELRATYSIPFIGIEPAIKPAALNSQTNKIGILATKGTLNSALFYNHAKNYDKTQIIEQVGHGLVELIEAGQLESIELYNLVKKYVDPMVEKEIDRLVLGCSHYPYLIKIIQSILPPHIQIIDSGLAVAKQTKRVLEQFELLNTNSETGDTLFYTNTSKDVLRSLVGSEYTIEERDF